MVPKFMLRQILLHMMNIEGLESYLRNLEKTGATGIIVPAESFNYRNM